MFQMLEILLLILEHPVIFGCIVGGLAGIVVFSMIKYKDDPKGDINGHL